MVTNTYETIYQHPDGGSIEFDASTLTLMVNEDTYPTVGVHIGPLGLIELGKKLASIGADLLKKSEVSA